jgi:hypothetical protein
MRSTFDNAWNVLPLSALPLPGYAPLRSSLAEAHRVAMRPHTSSKLATASGALRADERCAGVLPRDGSSNTSQYAVLHVEWQTGIHASNRRQYEEGRRKVGLDGEGDGASYKFPTARGPPCVQSHPSWSANGSCRSPLLAMRHKVHLRLHGIHVSRTYVPVWVYTCYVCADIRVHVAMHTHVHTPSPIRTGRIPPALRTARSCHVFGTPDDRTRFPRTGSCRLILSRARGCDRAPNRIHFPV